MRTIDLNADLGEGVGDDAGMLDLVTSANVSCGVHAGDPFTVRRTVADAAARGVTVGAHPSYRDREHFGRRALDVPAEELVADVTYQLGALTALAQASGTRIAYVKPHGALYNTIVHDEVQAAAVVEAVAAALHGAAVLGLPGSAFLRRAADAGLRPVTEAFADRAYTAEGTLAPRSLAGAVLHDPDAVVAQAVRIATEGWARTIDGGQVGVEAASLCVHGDTPGAVALARAVRAALTDAGVTIAPFARA